MGKIPLVSVIIPTHNRADLLVGRAIPSVLAQTHQNFEIIVVADRCVDGTRERVLGIGDSRIRFFDLKDRPPLPDDLRTRWRVASAAPRNKGLDMAKGEWITFLDDDDELIPSHMELLLARALEGYSLIYGKLRMLEPDGGVHIIGKYPPEWGDIGPSSFLYSSKYGGIRFDTDGYSAHEGGDWHLFRKIVEAGATCSFIDEVVYNHYKPIRDWEIQRQELENTGERMLPWCWDASGSYEHLHRYAFASDFVGGKTVVDLGSGEGYGANILAKRAMMVVGVEIDKVCVRHASSKYDRDNLFFIEGSITDVPIKGKHLFDVAVCLEAIEHIEDHAGFMREVKRLLKGTGVLIVSTPDRRLSADVTGNGNPFHLRELYLEEFVGLLNDNFRHVHILGQWACSGSNIWSLQPGVPQAHTEFIIDKGDEEFYFVGPGAKVQQYIIGVASDSYEIAGGISSSLFDISSSLARQYQAQISVLANHIKEVDQSTTIQLSKNLQSFADSVFPMGARRRRLYEMALFALRVTIRDGWRGLLRELRRWLLSPLQRFR